VTEVTDDTLTIDALARRTGLTVRNVRAHQARGLLPPPEVRGRTGFYGPEHVARLELVKELQADGFNLEAIRRLLEHAGGSTADVLRFARAVRAPWEAEAPRIVSLEALAERYGGAGDVALLERALELGLLRDRGGGRFEERSPRLGAAAEELARLGIGAGRVLAVLEAVHGAADAVAAAYVELFLDAVWQPFEAAGRPAERWPAVQEALEALRPLASDSLLAMFGVVMGERTEEAFGRELGRS
jgi:DNA-binding transcriptional MerR regulator